mgnify:FL=1
MAKPEPIEAPAPPDEITLHEFCTRVSQHDRRVELLGGFHAAETRAGSVKDTEVAFAARLTAFATQPA